jgi:chromate transport protein ChrA
MTQEQTIHFFGILLSPFVGFLFLSTTGILSSFFMSFLYFILYVNVFSKLGIAFFYQYNKELFGLRVNIIIDLMKRDIYLPWYVDLSLYFVIVVYFWTEGIIIASLLCVLIFLLFSIIRIQSKNLEKRLIEFYKNNPDKIPKKIREVLQKRNR